ncbi:cation diffusion facilitator family transporter [Intestinibacillus massiliensis]|uniref:cation diffusion facilitator family transporter n=1 Tax=Intestinibacillus massiliensis TaxID=1871029 RepID=UPI000B364AFD|nr:cation diffusion facilitator family transporter [Intestinibacillus massiliensis]
MEQHTNEQIAMRVSLITVVQNMVLSIFKLAAGLLAHSGAMISDAVHSASDVMTTFVVMAGVKLANKASDKEHPFGHERLECVAAIILSVMLGLTGLAIGWTGIGKIRAGGSSLAVPGGLALVAAIVSIIVKETMYWYTRAAAKKTGSGALMADAWHHRSDALSSVGSFIGILGARMGLPILDPIASVVICIFIVKAAVDIFRDAISKMTDRSCDDATIQALRDTVLANEQVLRIDRLNTRIFGDKFYVELEIGIYANLSLSEAHDIAEHVHDAVEQDFPKVKHCMVHVNPAEEHVEAMT